MDILIQKFCACCSSKQLILFEKYLQIKKYELPYTLIKSFRKHPNESIDFYCEIIYGNNNKDSLKKLNQLSSHTLKLFSFISKNFPTFLWRNFSTIEWYIINSKIKEATTLINLIYDVADKIEDYHAIIQLIHIIKQHFPAKNKKLQGIIKDKLMNNCVLYLQELEEVFTLHDEIIDKCIHSKYRVKKDHLTSFKKRFNSPSKSVQIIAKQSYLNILSYTNDKSFYSKQNEKIIKSTIKQNENNSYLLIAQYKEKLMSLDYMLIKQTHQSLDEKGMNHTCTKIISKWQNIYTDETVLDKGFTLALSVKGSYYITNYYHKKITEKLKVEIENIVNLCENLLVNIDWEKEGYMRYINFCNIFSIYLILANKEISAIKTLEKALHEYQQKSFKKSYNEIFVILLMAYYKASDFNSVIDSYHRYKKLTKSDISIIENDLIIKALYYSAQIIDNNRKQYHIKLDGVIKELEKDTNMKGDLQLVKRIKKSTLV